MSLPARAVFSPHRLPKVIVVLALLASASCSDNEDPSATGSVDFTAANRFREIALAEADPLPHVRDVSAVGSRFAGSAGDAKGVAWAVERMTALGFVNVHTEPVMVPHWERGEARAELLGATERPLTIAALGGSIATPNGGLEADVVRVGSLNELNALSADAVQGKFVFFDSFVERAKGIEGYLRVSPLRRTGPAAAARKGAVGALVRSLSTSDTPFPHTGDMSWPAGVIRIPAAAVAVPDAVVLTNALAAGPVRVRLTLGCRTLDDAESANVVGEIAGAESPDEIVLLGAHLDSWDLGTGSIDDGAGVGMVLETGRLLMRSPEPMRRTIRIVLFANEEMGLHGATAYATAHQSEFARHVMALEADLGDGRAYAVSVVAADAARLTQLLSPLAPLGITPAVYAENYGADVSPLRRAGVPVAELQQDMTRYFDFHHSAEDTIDAVDGASLTQATAAVAIFAYQMGRSAADWGRAP